MTAPEGSDYTAPSLLLCYSFSLSLLLLLCFSLSLRVFDHLVIQLLHLMKHLLRHLGILRLLELPSYPLSLCCLFMGPPLSHCLCISCCLLLLGLHRQIQMMPKCAVVDLFPGTAYRGRRWRCLVAMQLLGQGTDVPVHSVVIVHYFNDAFWHRIACHHLNEA